MRKCAAKAATSFVQKAPTIALKAVYQGLSASARELSLSWEFRAVPLMP